MVSGGREENGEVTGLASPPSRALDTLEAVRGRCNDNLLNIWDDRYASTNTHTTDQSLFRLDAHQAAVKALAWCPWQRNLLASGGGTADRTLRLWNPNPHPGLGPSPSCRSTLAPAPPGCRPRSNPDPTPIRHHPLLEL